MLYIINITITKVEITIYKNVIMINTIYLIILKQTNY